MGTPKPQPVPAIGPPTVVTSRHADGRNLTHRRKSVTTRNCPITRGGRAHAGDTQLGRWAGTLSGRYLARVGPGEQVTGAKPTATHSLLKTRY